MSSSPAVALCQDVPDHCRGIQIIKPHCLEVFESPPSKLINPDISSFGEDFTRTKARKPYTITKQRERWSEEEHNKFLEALKLYGRAWRRIEEHVGTKTAVQIRSHAQKFFSKLERESSTGMLSGKQSDIDIPPPRPKRKPSHPYPKKAVTSLQHTTTAVEESSNISPSGEFQVPPPATLPVNPNIGDDCHKPAAFFSSPGKSRLQAVRAALLQDLSPETAQTNGSQTKLKLFGKTVVVPFTQRATAISARKVLSDMGISFKDSSTAKITREGSSPSILVSRQDNESKEGFCPYVKATGGKSAPRLADDASLAVVNLDMRTSESGGSTCEDTKEPDIGSSSIRKAICRPEVEAKPPGNDLGTSSRDLAKLLQRRGDFPTCELRQESQEEVTKAENDSSKMQPAASVSNHKLTMMRTDILMSDSTSTSHNSLQVQVENQFHQYPGLVFPPGYSDGILQLNGCQGIEPANLLMPWQVLQGSVFHPPPTYASALPALSWPGMAVGRAASAKEESHPHTGSGFLHGHENGGTPAAAASTWWTLHGMLPPGFSNQAAANCGNTEVPSTVAKFRSNEAPVKVVKPAENKEQALSEETRLNGGSSTSDDLPELEKKVCCNLTSIHQTPCKLKCFGVSEESSVLDEIPPGRDSSADVLEEFSFSKTGKVDVGKKQKPCSSNGHDQAAKGRKRSREKSSCASNSPEGPGSCNSEISEHFLQWQHQCAEQFVHTLEQLPIDAQQEIREDNFGGSGDIAESGNDSAKPRLKKLQRAGKCQHQDLYSVNGDKGNLKHHRNCVLEAEQRKEVSMEGRKAFQALFSGKSLPQTFISPCDIERMSDYSKITDGIPLEITQSKESVKAIFDLQQVAEKGGSSTLQVMEMREEGMRNEKELEVEGRECEKNAALNVETEKKTFKFKCMNASMDISARLEKLEKRQNTTAGKKNGSFIQASIQGFRSTGQAFVPYKQALLEMRAKQK